MNVRPSNIVRASLAALFATGLGVAGAQAQTSPTDGRTGGTGPTSATPQTDRSMPSSGAGTSQGNADTAGNRSSGTNPTDGRNSGTGPMGNNPRTDTVGDSRGDMSGRSNSRSSSTSERYGNGGSASSDRVRQVQEALQAKGHDVGGVDGRMGPRTQAALRDYQQAQGMPSTGRLDASTMSGLGISDAGAGRNGQMNDRNTGPRSSTNPMSPTSGSTGRPSGG